MKDGLDPPAYVAASGQDRLDLRPRPIGRCVIDDHELVVVQILTKRRAQSLLDECLVVIGKQQERGGGSLR